MCEGDEKDKEKNISEEKSWWTTEETNATEFGYLAPVVQTGTDGNDVMTLAWANALVAYPRRVIDFLSVSVNVRPSRRTQQSEGGLR